MGGARMKFLSEDEYRTITKGDGYWTDHGDRWDYMRVAIEWMQGASSVLEIGAMGLPLSPESDHLDQWTLRGLEPTYKHDARVTPWPIADKAYDYVVALQVWEHLEGKQEAAFKEAARVARYVILSVPYCWGYPPDHAGIDDFVVYSWSGRQPLRARVVAGPPERKLYLWKVGK